MSEEKSLQPVKMSEDVWQIDLLEQNLRYRTGAYVILDEYPTLIETGSATSHDTLVAGLQALGLKPNDLAYIIVTHVHLDHAGGAGQMMALTPNGKLVVHPRGARHMVDPSKLWAGANSVYGERTQALFGSVVPVPEQQILVRKHEDELSIGKRTLTFFDSPGHAKHHFTILDPHTDALFAGDAVGVRYPRAFTGFDFDFILPSSSPIDFDPAAVQSTIEMLEQVPFQWVYHTHFGQSDKQTALRETLWWARQFEEMIRQVYQPGIAVDDVIQSLRQLIRGNLEQRGLCPGDLAVLDVDVVLDAMGLIYFEEKRRGKTV